MVLPNANHYEHIWDCCCDHGLLGMALLNSTNANIHFVDVVPHIMTQLKHKLETCYAEQTWKTHCLNVEELPIQTYKKDKHLVIIAGVGGDLAANLVTTLLQNQSNQNLDFLLCPVHRVYTLRKQLIKLNLRLKQEVIIKENKRFYEALWVTSSHDESHTIDPVGSILWQSQTHAETEVAIEYLQQTISYYRQVVRGNPHITHILEQYNDININRT